MIKLVLSTPRTGSTHYTETLRGNMEESVLHVLHEWMNNIINDRYVLVEENYTRITKGYVEGSYRLFPNQNGQILREYSSRSNTPEIDFDQWCNFLTENVKSENFIIHEHINRIPIEWVKRLISISDEVYYISRNLKEQLASYIIATHTGVYIYANNIKYCFGNISNISDYEIAKFEKSIINMSIVDDFIKELKISSEIVTMLGIIPIKYEEQVAKDSVCEKKFASSYDRLCKKDQEIIDQLCLLN
jgi:hypothetical protein